MPAGKLVVGGEPGAVPPPGPRPAVVEAPVAFRRHPMPKLDGILETALYVDDLERSARFYHDIFGFQIIDGEGGRLWSMHVHDRQILLLCKKGASANMERTAHDGDGRLHLAFAIPAEELHAWESWLARHGVAIEDKVTWERGGCSLYFRDPDQHILEVATPGVWPRVY